MSKSPRVKFSSLIGYWGIIHIFMYYNFSSLIGYWILYLCTTIFCHRDDPPGKSVATASQELLRMIESNIHGLPGLDPVKDLHLRDIDLVEKFRSLQLIEDSFKIYQCINCPHFIEHVIIYVLSKKCSYMYTFITVKKVMFFLFNLLLCIDILVIVCKCVSVFMSMIVCITRITSDDSI